MRSSFGVIRTDSGVGTSPVSKTKTNGVLTYADSIGRNLTSRGKLKQVQHLRILKSNYENMLKCKKKNICKISIF